MIENTYFSKEHLTESTKSDILNFWNWAEEKGKDNSYEAFLKSKFNTTEPSLASFKVALNNLKAQGKIKKPTRSYLKTEDLQKKLDQRLAKKSKEEEKPKEEEKGFKVSDKSPLESFGKDKGHIRKGRPRKIATPRITPIEKPKNGFNPNHDYSWQFYSWGAPDKKLWGWGTVQAFREINKGFYEMNVFLQNTGDCKIIDNDNQEVFSREGWPLSLNKLVIRFKTKELDTQRANQLIDSTVNLFITPLLIIKSKFDKNNLNEILLERNCFQISFKDMRQGSWSKNSDLHPEIEHLNQQNTEVEYLKLMLGDFYMKSIDFKDPRLSEMAQKDLAGLWTIRSNRTGKTMPPALYPVIKQKAASLEPGSFTIERYDESMKKSILNFIKE
jgi:hypothetical protein